MESRLEKLTLYEHLREVGEQLLCEPAWHRDAVEDMLDEVLGDIMTLHQGYGGPVPPGAEAVRAFVSEALELYAQCVESLKEYLDDPEEIHIAQGLAKAEEAEDLLTAVEMVIQENKELLDGALMS